LSDKSSFKNLLAELNKIVETDKDYVSHNCALFLHGFGSKPQKRITIVSSRRRRHRILNGYEIVFIFHSKFDNKNILKINAGDYQLSVSNLEKTLIDLCKDQAYALPLKELAELFCVVPYNLKKLIHLAAQTSDSVIKRVCFLLAWSGRASYKDIPFEAFKRTPVFLDTREKEDLCWNSLFYSKIPRFLLRKPVKLPPFKMEDKTRLWMELKSLPEFVEKQYEAEMVFIRGTPKSEINLIIESYFKEIFQSFTSQKLKKFLEGYSNKNHAANLDIPELLRTYLHHHPDILLTRKEEIEAWARQNLKSTNSELIEAAIYYGLLAGLEQEVFAAFENNCEKLFNSGKFNIINYFTDYFANSEFDLSTKMLVIISKTLSMQENFDKAINLLEQAQEKAESNKCLRTMGELHYATGLVYQKMEKAEDALSELFLARESFSIENCPEQLTKTECSLGNLYLSRGHHNFAKSFYFSGLKKANNFNFKHLKASFLANIGMVEFDIGHFRKAAIYFEKAFKMNKMIKNYWNVSIVGMATGKLQLKLSHFSKALKTFKEILPIYEEKHHSSGIYEIYILIAWLYEIIGKSATARTYWNQAENFNPEILQPRARFVGNMLKAVNHFYYRNFDLAETNFEIMLETANSKGASSLQKAEILNGLAACKFFLNKTEDACRKFKQVRELLKDNNSRLQNKQVNFLAKLFLPEHFKELDLNKCLSEILATEVFEPLWIHLAPKLIEIDSENAKKYLVYHLDHTPPAALEALLSRFPDLQKCINKIAKKKNRAGQFITLLSADEHKVLHFDDYRKWQSSYPQNFLVFDAPAGIVHFNGSQVHLKKDSIPHKLLLQLFLAMPHPIDIETIYSAIWCLDFDPDYDYSAFKSSLQRLKKRLKRVVQAITIKRVRSKKGLRAVKLGVSVPWLLAYK
jgi:tetratricopeptide (TPR) repeat protein